MAGFVGRGCINPLFIFALLIEYCIIKSKKLQKLIRGLMNFKVIKSGEEARILPGNDPAVLKVKGTLSLGAELMIMRSHDYSQALRLI